jgi:hypothetical protein
MPGKIGAYVVVDWNGNQQELPYQGLVALDVAIAYVVDNTGATDASTNLQNAFNSCAAQGVPALLPPGQYLIKKPVTIPSNLELFGGPLVTINSNVPGGGLANSTFLTAVPTATSQTTLQANNTVGAATISTNGRVTNGQIISIASVLSGVGQYFKVSSVSGAGPYTVTLDRPVLRQFVTNDVVKLLPSQPSNILWHGRGMVFSGVATCYVLFQGALNCLIEDCNALVGSNHDVVFPFIAGSLRCQGKRLRCDGQGAGPPSAVLGFSSAEDCLYEDCYIWGAINGTQLYKTVDSVRCGYRNVYANGVGTGISFGTDTVQNIGCIKCWVDVAHLDGNTNGIDVGDYSDGTLIHDVTCNYNSGFGIQIEPNTTNTSISLLQSIGNGTYGLNVAATAGFINVVNGNIEASGTSAFNLAGGATVNVDNVSMRCVTGSPIGVSISAGTAKFTRCLFKHLTGGAASFFINITGGTVRFTDCDVQVGVTGDVAVQIAGASTVVVANGCSLAPTDAATSTFGWYIPASGTLRIGPGEENTCATPITVAGSGQVNRKQTVTTSSGTGTFVAWTDIKVDDTVQFMATATGGYVPTPGYMRQATGFQVLVPTGTWQYEYFIP